MNDHITARPMPNNSLLGPEAQKNPHHWAATFGAHAYLALGLWGGAALLWDKWSAVWIAPLLYLIFWEGLQLYLSKRVTAALVFDAILDTVAVAFGCYAAALVGRGYNLEAMWAWSASVVVMAVGWMVRE